MFGSSSCCFPAWTREFAGRSSNTPPKTDVLIVMLVDVRVLGYVGGAAATTSPDDRPIANAIFPPFLSSSTCRPAASRSAQFDHRGGVEGEGGTSTHRRRFPRRPAREPQPAEEAVNKDRTTHISASHRTNYRPASPSSWCWAVRPLTAEPARRRVADSRSPRDAGCLRRVSSASLQQQLQRGFQVTRICSACHSANWFVRDLASLGYRGEVRRSQNMDVGRPA